VKPNMGYILGCWTWKEAFKKIRSCLNLLSFYKNWFLAVDSKIWFKKKLCEVLLRYHNWNRSDAGTNFTKEVVLQQPTAPKLGRSTPVISSQHWFPRQYSFFNSSTLTSSWDVHHTPTRSRFRSITNGFKFRSKASLGGSKFRPKAWQLQVQKWSNVV
jgi:hypothetical protein